MLIRILVTLIISLAAESAWSQQVRLRPKNKPTVRKPAKAKSTKQTKITRPTVKAKKKAIVNSKPVEVFTATSAEIQPKLSTLTLFTMSGSVPVGRLFALQLSPQVFAARLKDDEQINDLSKRVRVLYSDKRHVPLSLIEIDIETRWALFKSNEPIPIMATNNTLPREYITYFGYTDDRQARAEFSEIIQRLKGDRNLAGITSPVTIIERDLGRLERQVLNHLSLTNSVQLEGFYLIPTQKMNCESMSPQIVAPDLQKKISGGNGIQCTNQSNSKFRLKFQAGIIDFWANTQAGSPEREQIIEELTKKELESLDNETHLIQNSTYSVCQKSFITDSSLYAYFCTRSLRTAPGFQDTLAIFGKKSKQKFVYSMVRTGALSPNGTKQLMELMMKTLESNP